MNNHTFYPSISRNASNMSSYRNNNTGNHSNFGTTPRFKYIQMQDKTRGT